MKSTLNDRRDPVDVCKAHGWDVGTVLVGDEGYGPTIIQITALGERNLLAKGVSHNGKPLKHDRESCWTLECRDWAEVVGVE